jgi:hypothetical protein
MNLDVLRLRTGLFFNPKVIYLLSKHCFDRSSLSDLEKQIILLFFIKNITKKGGRA